jgi:hypothetical protein
MNTNTTLWKKKSFSDNGVSVDEEFQTLNMMYKIDQVKKKSDKKKKVFNYKNIELLENIHETPPLQEGLTFLGMGKDDSPEIEKEIDRFNGKKERFKGKKEGFESENKKQIIDVTEGDIKNEEGLVFLGLGKDDAVRIDDSETTTTFKPDNKRVDIAFQDSNMRKVKGNEQVYYKPNEKKYYVKDTKLKVFNSSKGFFGKYEEQSGPSYKLYNDDPGQHKYERKKNEIDGNRFVDGSKSGEGNPDGTWTDTNNDIEKGEINLEDGNYYVTKVDEKGKPIRGRDGKPMKVLYDGPLDKSSGIPLTPDFWEGLDNGDTGKNPNDPRDKIWKFLMKIRKTIKDFNEKRAKYIADGFSSTTKENFEDKSDEEIEEQDNKQEEEEEGFGEKKKINIFDNKPKPNRIDKPNVDYIKNLAENNVFSNAFKKQGKSKTIKGRASPHDVALVKKWLSVLDSVTLAYFFAYNIFFVTLYYDSKGEKIEIPKITSESLKQGAAGGYPINYLIIYFFGYAFRLSDIFETFLLETFPSFSQKFMNPPLFLMSLFLGFTFILENFVDYFLLLLHKFIFLDTSNSLVSGVLFMVVIFFILDCISPFSNPNTFWFSISWVSRFFLLIFISWFIVALQLIIALATAAPVGALLCVVIMLFLGTSIIWYPFYNVTSPGGWGELFSNLFSLYYYTYNNINMFMKKSFMLDFDPTQKLTTQQTFVSITNVIFDFLCSFIYFIVIALVLSFALVEFNSLENETLRKNIFFLVGTLVFSIVSYCCIGLARKIGEDRQMKTDDIFDATPLSE